MKKMLLILTLGLFVTAVASAQTTKMESGGAKVKVKPKTTPKQKVHNIIHPKRKENSGLKVKGKKD